MKKLFIISVVLIMLVGVVALSGCGSEPDVWDGSVAAGFAGGDGTEEKPYKIKTGAELAYLAKSVNEGDSYTGKYFVLENDIDLDGISWTPIGNSIPQATMYLNQPTDLEGSNFFSGEFNGNSKTIKNLFVDKVYEYEYHFNSSFKNALSGLFGACIDANIYNLCIEDAKVDLSNYKCNEQVDGISIGILAGKIGATDCTKIEDITVKNAKISISSDETIAFIVNMGGCVGTVINLGDPASGGSVALINRTSVNLSIDTLNDNKNFYNVGGILANATLIGELGITDFESNISIDADDSKARVNCGAIGNINDIQSKITVKNGFSTIKSNYEILCEAAPNSHIKAFPMITTMTKEHNSQDKKTTFENVFGYAEGPNGNQSFTLSPNMYEISSLYITNCIGTTSLPEGHGFAPEVWDLSDLSNPRLK